MGNAAELADRGVTAARAWCAVAVVTLLYVLSFVDRAVLGLLAIPIKQDLGLTDVELSLLLGLSFALFYSVLSIPAGTLVDRVSRRAVIGYGVILWSLMTMTCGLARSYGALFVGRMGVGVGEAALSPAAFSLIRSILPPDRRGRAYAIYSLGPAFGAGAALLIGGWLIGRLAAQGGVDVPFVGHLRPWQAVLMLVGSLGIPLSALALTLPEPARQVAPGGGGGFAEAVRFIGAHWRLYLPLALFGALMSAIAFSYSAWLPTLIARTWHIPPAQIGLRVGLTTVVCAPVGVLSAGFAMDWFGRFGRPDAIASVGLVTSAATLVFAAAIPFAGSFDSATVLIGCYLLVNGTFYAVGATALARITPARMMGKLTALYLLIQGVFGQALGPVIVAYAEQLFDGPLALGAGLSLSGVVLAAGGLVCLAVLRPRLGALTMKGEPL